jgi:ABC-type uncharacterized transport system substrate-binding protein
VVGHTISPKSFDGRFSLSEGWLPGIEQTDDPLVRPVWRILLLSALLAALLVVSTADTAGSISAGQEKISLDVSGRAIVWVDFDVDPAKAVFRTFSTRFAAMRQGRSVRLQFFGADVASPPHLRAQMSLLLRQRPALIVATSVSVAQALQALHAQVPVYFIIQSDPVRDGLVSSLRSTGAVTGYTYFVPLDVKTLEIIQRIFPRSRVGILTDAFWLEGRNMSPDLFEQCRATKIPVKVFRVESETDIDRLSLDPRVASIDVWYIPYSPIAFDYGPQIVKALSKTGAATVYARSKFLHYGGLFSVQAFDPDAMETWAKTILDIMDGVPIGSIPVIRPKEIEVDVNPAALPHLDRQTRLRIAREITGFQRN